MEFETPLVNSVYLVTLKSTGHVASHKTVIVWKPVAWTHEVNHLFHSASHWARNSSHRAFVTVCLVSWNSTEHTSVQGLIRALAYSSFKGNLKWNWLATYTAVENEKTSLTATVFTKALHCVYIIIEKDKNYYKKIDQILKFWPHRLPKALEFYKTFIDNSWNCFTKNDYCVLYTFMDSNSFFHPFKAKQVAHSPSTHLKVGKRETIMMPPTSNWELEACVTYTLFFKEKAKGPWDLSGFSFPRQQLLGTAGLKPADVDCFPGKHNERSGMSKVYCMLFGLAYFWY